MREVAARQRKEGHAQQGHGQAHRPHTAKDPACENAENVKRTSASARKTAAGMVEMKRTVKECGKEGGWVGHD
ncbi:hypothetical protein IAT38_006753 [Cryptococcus sp. DSM 104549]